MRLNGERKWNGLNLGRKKLGKWIWEVIISFSFLFFSQINLGCHMLPSHLIASDPTFLLLLSFFFFFLFSSLFNNSPCVILRLIHVQHVTARSSTTSNFYFKSSFCRNFFLWCPISVIQSTLKSYLWALCYRNFKKRKKN